MAESSTNSEQLIRRAVAALYEAKRKERNRVEHSVADRIETAAGQA